MKIERFIASGGGGGAGGGFTIPHATGSGAGVGKGLVVLGSALQGVGKDVWDVDEHFRRARQASLLSGLQVGLLRETSDAEIEYNDRQDYEKFTDISGRIDKMRQNYVEQIGNDGEVFDAFMPYFEKSAIRLQTEVRKLARTKFVSADTAAMGNEIENVLEVAGRNAGKYDIVSGELRAMGHGLIAGRIASGVIDPVSGEITKDKFDAKLWDNYLTSYVEKDPIGAEEDLKDDGLFPGLDKSRRLQWQSTAGKAATERRIDDTTYGLMDLHGNDFDSAYKDLEAIKGLSRYEHAKVFDALEKAEKDYKNKAREIQSDGKQVDMDNFYSLINDGNLAGAEKYNQRSKYFDEKDKFNNLEKIKNLREEGQGKAWKTDPVIEAKITRKIDEGSIDESFIEFHRGLGLSNETTDKLKNRLKAKRNDPVKTKIISDAVSYASSRWKAAFPDKDDDTHFAYEQFENDMRNELESMSKDKPLTRAEATRHVDEYFQTKEEPAAFLGIIPYGRDYKEVEKKAGEYKKGMESVDVPEEDRGKIKAFLDNQGIDSRPESVKKFYDLNKDKPQYQQLIAEQLEPEKEESDYIKINKPDWMKEKEAKK